MKVARARRHHKALLPGCVSSAVRTMSGGSLRNAAATCKIARRSSLREHSGSRHAGYSQAGEQSYNECTHGEGS
jgi:hypothetical protein